MDDFSEVDVHFLNIQIENGDIEKANKILDLNNVKPNRESLDFALSMVHSIDGVDMTSIANRIIDSGVEPNSEHLNASLGSGLAEIAIRIVTEFNVKPKVKNFPTNEQKELYEKEVEKFVIHESAKENLSDITQDPDLSVLSSIQKSSKLDDKLQAKMKTLETKMKWLDVVLDAYYRPPLKEKKRNRGPKQ